MKLPRDVDGQRFAEHLIRFWSYQRMHQTGSHIQLKTEIPFEQTISIPAHKPLKVGMFAALLRTVCEHKSVTRDQVLRFLI